jgi:hypothetical protein
MTAKIDGEQVNKTYTGPRRLPGTDPITEVVKTGDFEGVVTWVIGLDSKRSFTTNASRLRARRRDRSLLVAVQSTGSSAVGDGLVADSSFAPEGSRSSQAAALGLGRLGWWSDDAFAGDSVS